MKCLNCEKCENDCQLEEVDIPPLFCMNCQPPSEAPCLKECPNDAIELLGGAITINNQKCDKCRICENICPFSIIKI